MLTAAIPGIFSRSFCVTACGAAGACRRQALAGSRDTVDLTGRAGPARSRTTRTVMTLAAGPASLILTITPSILSRARVPPPVPAGAGGPLGGQSPGRFQLGLIKSETACASAAPPRTGEVRPDLLEDLLDVLVVEGEALRRGLPEKTTAHHSTSCGERVSLLCGRCGRAVCARRLRVHDLLHLHDLRDALLEAALDAHLHRRRAAQRRREASRARSPQSAARARGAGQQGGGRGGYRAVRCRACSGTSRRPRSASA